MAFDSVPRGFRLDFLLKLLVLDLRVALEGEPIDDRSLDDGHHEPTAPLRDADILEQARGVKRLQRGIDSGGIKRLARSDLEVGADGFGFDAPVAFDDDRGAAFGRRRPRLTGRDNRGRDNGRDAKQNYAEEQAGHD